MATKSLTPAILDEIKALSQAKGIDAQLLEQFAFFVLEHQKAKLAKRPKPLSMKNLKDAILAHFEVKDTTALRKSGSFKMATDGMEKLNFRLKESWEMLYRKFVGVLPGEGSEVGDHCINGIDIFKYFQPWKVFGLDAKTANNEDIKQAYRRLSKQYHPDNKESGDSRMFERINIMYQSIAVEA